MRALVRSGEAPEHLRLEDLDEPRPEPHECVIEVFAAGLNRGELRLLGTRPDGWRPGQDVAGVVAQPAAAGGGPPKGARVVALADQAGWAERVAVPVGRVATLPGAVGFAQGASLPVAGLTALRALREGGLLLGRRVLVTGASGGVGHFAVQLAAAAGAEVLAVGTRRSTSEAVPGTWVSALEEAPDRFDLVLESVGGPSLAQAISKLAPGGALVLFGNSSGAPAPLDFRGLFDCPLARVFFFFVYATEKERPFAPDLALLAERVASGGLEARVDLKVPWTEAARAVELLRNRRVTGKAVFLLK